MRLRSRHTPRAPPHPARGGPRGAAGVVPRRLVATPLRSEKNGAVKRRQVTSPTTHRISWKPWLREIPAGPHEVRRGALRDVAEIAEVQRSGPPGGDPDRNPPPSLPPHVFP